MSGKGFPESRLQDRRAGGGWGTRRGVLGVRMGRSRSNNPTERRWSTRRTNLKRSRSHRTPTPPLPSPVRGPDPPFHTGGVEVRGTRLAPVTSGVYRVGQFDSGAGREVEILLFVKTGFGLTRRTHSLPVTGMGPNLLLGVPHTHQPPLSATVDTNLVPATRPWELHRSSVTSSLQRVIPEETGSETDFDQTSVPAISSLSIYRIYSPR